MHPYPIHHWRLVLAAWIALAGTGLGGGVGCETNNPSLQLRVRDLLEFDTQYGPGAVVTSPGAPGTSAVTNYVDGWSLGRATEADRLTEGRARAVFSLVRRGIPVLLDRDVTGDEDPPTATQPGTVTVGSEILQRILHVARGSYSSPTTNRAPAVQSTLRREADDTYRVQQIDLRLRGRSLWLLYRPPADDEESGMTGLRLEKAF